jgi:hypothetical protein
MSVVNHMPDYVFGNCKVANPLAGTELHRGILPVALLRSSRGTLWRKSYQHASCDTPISNIASTSSAGGRGNVSVHPRWDRAGGRVKSQRLLTRDLRARGNAFFLRPQAPCGRLRVLGSRNNARPAVAGLSRSGPPAPVFSCAPFGWLAWPPGAAATPLITEINRNHPVRLDLDGRGSLP